MHLSNDGVLDSHIIGLSRNLLADTYSAKIEKGSPANIDSIVSFLQESVDGSLYSDDERDLVKRSGYKNAVTEIRIITHLTPSEITLGYEQVVERGPVVRIPLAYKNNNHLDCWMRRKEEYSKWSKCKRPYGPDNKDCCHEHSYVDGVDRYPERYKGVDYWRTEPWFGNGKLFEQYCKATVYF